MPLLHGLDGRLSNNDKRRLLPAPDTAALAQSLFQRAHSRGSPKHKLHPNVFGLPPYQGARIEVQMRNLGLEPGFIALCPFSTRPQKHRFDDHWQSLAGLIATAGLGRCVVFGGPADRKHAPALVAATPEGSLSLAGDTTLHELPGNAA